MPTSGPDPADRNEDDLLEIMPDPIITMDTLGFVQRVNRAALKVSGYTFKELVGKHFLQLKIVKPAYLAKTAAEFALVLSQKERPPYEVELFMKDGSLKTFEAHPCLGRAKGGEVILAVILRDLTVRKEYEAQARLHSAALEAVANGIVITDPQGRILWVNPAFTRMTGYAFEEVAGKTPRILKSGQMRPEEYEQLWQTVLAGRVWIGELVNRCKDGSLYNEKQMISPLKDESGQVTHFIAVKQNISEEKRLEAQFRQAQKMEAVGRLAGGIAHDFNNLLTIIIGYSDILLQEQGENSPAGQLVREIRTAGSRAAALTRQLLAFSRKQILQPRVIDISDVLRNSEKLLARLLGEDIEFEARYADGLPPLKVDPYQMDQVIMNLALNSRDAMPGGGGFLLETSKASMDASACVAYPGLKPGDYVLIRATDTGCGMTPEVQSHLFEPFFTTKEKGKGTGLGLATVYGIVKQSNGYIYAESESGKGTTFLIFLPPSAEPLSAEAAAAESSFRPGSGVILVAEDEGALLTYVSGVLSQQGYTVIQARTGVDALRAAEVYQGPPIRLLFSDTIMPRMGGAELAEKFLALYPGTPILFTTGYTERGPVQKWIDQGYRLLQKPYTRTQLLFAIQEALQ